MESASNLSTRNWKASAEFTTDPKPTMAEIISREGTASAHMSMQEKIRVVHKLDADGILMMKGAVAEIADQLSVSVPTIYRYLNKPQA